MQDITSSLQALSYTNKDFALIFPELISTVKQLQSKWDPSVSNESDPGIILLKLLALLGDKCNYGIDTSILEAFPISVTQNNNARNLYEQLGYYMHWYQSAAVEVTLSWKGTSVYQAENSTIPDYIEFPYFAMVTDTDTNIVYTLICESVNAVKTPTRIKLPLDGSEVKCYALQGVANQFTINSDQVITADQLDSNNRLYFTSTNIAENGLFITNSYSDVNQNNYAAWQKRDNLTVENLGNTYYKFGVCNNNSTCYIEFPSDAVELFGGGINIVYLTSQGTAGSIFSSQLSKFYSDLSLTSYLGTGYVLSSDNVNIYNAAASIGGANAESINDAYIGYKRTSGTFNTLITLRDYTNYILKSGLVSNCFVTDRTNDPQTTYNIVKLKNGLDQIERQIEVVVEDDETTSPQMNAFNLKLYLLKYVTNIVDRTSYADSFTLLDNSSRRTIEEYITDVKCLSHDIQDLLPRTPENAHICFFKNKYPVNCTVQTTSTLTASEKSDVQQNIIQALYSNLNAQQLDFGENVSHAHIKEIILNSDTRIKDLNWDSNIVGSVYAVYFEFPEDYDPEDTDTDWMSQLVLKEIEISSTDSDPITIDYTYNTEIFKAGKEYPIDAYVMHNGLRYHNATGAIIKKQAWIAKNWEYAPVKLNYDKETFIRATATEERGIANYESVDFEYTDAGGWSPSLATYGISNVGVFPPKNGDTFTAHVSVKTQFRDDVYVKSVLGGNTEILENNEPFDYKLSQLYGADEIDETPGGILEDISAIETAVDITFTKTASSATSNEITPPNVYQLKDNERLQLYAPNLLEGTTYQSGVRYEYHISQDVDENECYQFTAADYIIFYYKEDADDDSAVFTYYAYGENNIIKPSFKITKDTTSTIIGAELVTPSMWKQVITSSGTVYESSSKYNGDMSTALSEKVALNVSNRLSSTKTIQLDYLNRLSLTNSNRYYWVTNQQTVAGQYVLFEAATKWQKNTSEEAFSYVKGHYLYFDNDVDNIYEILKDIDEDVNERATKRGQKVYLINNGYITALPLETQTKLLDNGEYFIYSDATATQMSMLSSGTTITRPASRYAWVCEPVSLEDIVNKGTSALDGYWQMSQLSRGQYIEVVENKYINLNPGTYVSLVDKGESALGVLSETVTFTKESKSLADYDLWYWTSDYTAATKATDMLLIDETEKSNYTWKARTLLSLSLNNIEPTILRENQKLFYYQSENTSPQVIEGHEARQLDEGTPEITVTYTSETLDGVSVNNTTFVEKVGKGNTGNYEFVCGNDVNATCTNPGVTVNIDKATWRAKKQPIGIHEFKYMGDMGCVTTHNIPNCTVAVNAATFAQKFPNEGNYLFEYYEKGKQLFVTIDAAPESTLAVGDINKNVYLSKLPNVGENTFMYTNIASFSKATALQAATLDEKTFSNKVLAVAGDYVFHYVPEYTLTVNAKPAAVTNVNVDANKFCSNEDVKKVGDHKFTYVYDYATEASISPDTLTVAVDTSTFITKCTKEKTYKYRYDNVVIDWSSDTTKYSIDTDIFRTKVTTAGTSTFTYDASAEAPKKWKLGTTYVDITDYGITVQGAPEDTETITVTRSNDKVWVVAEDFVPTARATYQITLADYGITVTGTPDVGCLITIILTATKTWNFGVSKRKNKVVSLEDYGIGYEPIGAEIANGEYITIKAADNLASGWYLGETQVNLAEYGITNAPIPTSDYDTLKVTVIETGYWELLPNQFVQINLAEYGITLAETSEIEFFDKIKVRCDELSQGTWYHNNQVIVLSTCGIVLSDASAPEEGSYIKVLATKWQKSGTYVAIADYGISYTGSMATGDIISVHFFYMWRLTTVTTPIDVSLAEYGITTQGTYAEDDAILVSYGESSYSYWPTCVLLSTTCTLTGAEIVNVLDISSDGTITYPMLYQFRQKITSNVGDQYYNDAGYAILKFYADSNDESPKHEQVIKLAMPQGNYVIPIMDSNLRNIIHMQLLLDNVPLTTIYDSSIDSFTNSKTEYLSLTLTDTKEHTLTVKILDNKLKNDHTITLMNPYKYEKPAAMSDFDFARLLKLLSILDYDHEYDYTYKVTDTDKMVDPLSGISFMRGNHIFNKNTICMIDENQLLTKTIVIGDN